MPLVKILTLRNIVFVRDFHWAVSIMKWLQSMPQIAYFRTENMIPQILELLYDHETMKPLAGGQTPSEHILCPKIGLPSSRRGSYRCARQMCTR